MIDDSSHVEYDLEVIVEIIEISGWIPFRWIFLSTTEIGIVSSEYSLIDISRCISLSLRDLFDLRLLDVGLVDLILSDLLLLLDPLLLDFIPFVLRLLNLLRSGFLLFGLLLFDFIFSPSTDSLSSNNERWRRCSSLFSLL